jgi:YYY domain-containing protein
MVETIAWWATAELVGVLAFPLTFTFFGRLPDRGYAFAKVLGFLLLGYALWIGATLGLFPNTRGTVLLLLAILAVISAALAGRRREDIVTFIRENGSYILFVEILFLAAFATAAYLRSYTPDISGTEKPMDLAFLNGVLRSEQFPAQDPWFSGHSISYYYFGYIIVGVVTKLTGVAASVAFNLGLVLFSALAVTAGFGLVYNLVRGMGARASRALLFGLVGVVLMLLLGNLEGVFEMLSAHGADVGSLYAWANISGLEGPADTTEWYPTSHWWWWRATRYCGGWCIEEFPFFSYLLGDLHAHLMVVPFTVLITAIGLDLFLRNETIDWRFLLRQPLAFFLIALAIGSLSFLNGWDMPVFLFIIVAIVLLQNYIQERRWSQSVLVATASFAVPVTALAVLMFVPYYLHFHPVVEFPYIDAIVATASWEAVNVNVTTPTHLFLFWGPLLWLATCLAVSAIAFGHRPWLSIRRAWLAMAIGLIPIAFWALWVVMGRGPGDFGEEVSGRGSAWLTVFLLVAVLGATAVAGVRLLSEGAQGAADRSLLFALLASFTAILLLLGCDLFYVPEPPEQIRADTVFKLWHKAWILLGASGAFGLYYLTSRWRGRDLTAVVGGSALAVVTALLLLSAMVYPLAGTFARTNGFTGEPTLNGLAFVQRLQPAEYDAILWLNANVQGTPVILEAYGDVFGPYGRVSSRTGLPTLLSWTDHQLDWRGPQDAFEERRTAMERAYTTTSPAEALAILDEYDVSYVYVGRLEREQYGQPGTAKFSSFMEVAYQNDSVTIYRMRPTVDQMTSLP